MIKAVKYRPWPKSISHGCLYLIPDTICSIYMDIEWCCWSGCLSVFFFVFWFILLQVWEYDICGGFTVFGFFVTGLQNETVIKGIYIWGACLCYTDQFMVFQVLYAFDNCRAGYPKIIHQANLGTYNSTSPIHVFNQKEQDVQRMWIHFIEFCHKWRVFGIDLHQALQRELSFVMQILCSGLIYRTIRFYRWISWTKYPVFCIHA